MSTSSLHRDTPKYKGASRAKKSFAGNSVQMLLQQDSGWQQTCYDHGKRPSSGQVTLETVTRAGESPEEDFLEEVSPQAELPEQGHFL